MFGRSHASSARTLSERRPGQRLTPAFMTSPERAGGGGFTYENAIAAYYLVAMIGGTTATGTVTEEAFRNFTAVCELARASDSTAVFMQRFSDGGNASQAHRVVLEAVLRSGGGVAAAQCVTGQAKTPPKLPSRSALSRLARPGEHANMTYEKPIHHRRLAGVGRAATASGGATDTGPTISRCSVKPSWAKTWAEKQNGPQRPVFTIFLAEKAGFEPAEGFTPRTLSRRVT